ncbi:MAG TPA: HAD-IA family hydrolase [Actinomycetota bacterium]|nr:HAD-IA family hydrolase [Actinomycetota bacterium]
MSAIDAARRDGGIDIVFLDAGDTILYPHPSFSEIFARVATDHGYPIEPSDVDDVRHRLAPHLVDIAEDSGVGQGVASLSAENSRVFWSFLYRRFLEELGLPHEALVDPLFDVFSSTSTYRLFDDVLPALGELGSRGYRLGLISNFERWLEEMLVELEVGHIFDVAVISGVEGVEKPDTTIYVRALEKAGVAAANAVHVGDSPGLDVAPAGAVGMRTVLLDRLGRYEDHEGHRITSLKDLPDLLTKL